MSSSMGNECDRKQPLSSAQLDALFSAVSHPARRRILVSLHARGGAMTAGEIADRFKHSWPTTTRHLGVLDDAQLLQVQKQGRNRFYMLRPDALTQASKWLVELAADQPDYRDRPEWTTLPYGTMRNVTPPKQEEDPS